ncbi:MAG: hypothetical protein AABM42_12420 [Actinomycetota bacterium]
MKEYDWGNTHSFRTCEGNWVASDGNVAIIRPKDSFGYQDHWPEPAFTGDSSNLVDRAEDGGVTVARYGVSWGTVGVTDSQPGSCERPAGNWNDTVNHPNALYDAIYFKLTGSHACTAEPLRAGAIRPLIIASGAAEQYDKWRCDNLNTQDCTGAVGSCTAETSPNPDINGPATITGSAANLDWQDFVRSLAERYPWARGIEVRNEPNHRNFWGGCAPEPARYAALLRHADAGVDQADPLYSIPKVPVVLAGMSPQEDPEDDGMEWRTYLEQVAATANASATPLAEQFDVLGLHPYRSRGDRNRGEDFQEAVMTDVRQARTLLADPGVDAAGKTVWVTEVGVRTTGDSDFPTWVSSADAQANALRNIYQVLRNDSRVPVVIVHRFVDSTSDEDVDGIGYGVLRAWNHPYPLSAKIAYRCLALARGVAPPIGDCP